MKLHILHTNDTHSYINNIAKRADYINKVRLENNNVLVLDAGDIISGTVFFSLFKGELEAEIIKKIGYDYLGLGNHEFDGGIELLSNYMEKVETPFIHTNSNLYKHPLFKDIDIRKSDIKEFEGIKIGIVSATIEKFIHAMESDEYYYEDLYECLEKEIVKLKENNADIIIAINHLGYELDKELAQSDLAIDIIIGGHSHSKLESPVEINNTLIMQTGSYGDAIGHLILELTEDEISYDYKLIDLNEYKDNDKEIKEIIDKANAVKAQKYDEIIGVVAHELIGHREIVEKSGTNLTTFICDSFIHSAKENKIDVDFALINCGGVRTSILQGPITREDIYKVLPFEQQVVVIEILGKDLISAINTAYTSHTTGLYIENNDEELKLYYLKDNKKTYLEKNESYKLVTNEYVAKGYSYYDDMVNHNLVAELGLDVNIVSEYVEYQVENFEYKHIRTLY